MQIEVEQDRERARQAKQHKREKEQRVLVDNEMQIMGKIQQKRFDKEEDHNAFQSFKSLVDNDEERRNRERQERQDRIKKVLNRQAIVTVDQHSVHHSNDVDIDKKIKEHQDRLVFEEKLKQEKKREEQRRMQEDMKNRLDLQV